MSVEKSTGLEQFVRNFMKKRTEQKGGSMQSLYIQNMRLERLRNYLSQKYPLVASMKKSKSLDFMIFLLEGFLSREYGDYKTFNDEWDESQVKLVGGN